MDAKRGGALEPQDDAGRRRAGVAGVGRGAPRHRADETFSRRADQQGPPEREKLADPVADQIAFLSASLDIARAAGVGEDRIVLDPGFGFAKETAAENLDLMARLGALHALGRPLLVGASRKRFVGEVTGRDVPEDRDPGTAATSVILRLQGAAVFRVHDVAMNADALAVADAMIGRGLTAGKDEPGKDER